MGATRLPGKVMRPIEGVPMIGLLLQRLARARSITQIVVATSADLGNAPLADYVRGLGYKVYEGSEHDVLDRYYRAALVAGAAGEDVVVRITGDCPLIDGEVVDEVVDALRKADADYASNVQPPTYRTVWTSRHLRLRRWSGRSWVLDNRESVSMSRPFCGSRRI